MSAASNTSVHLYSVTICCVTPEVLTQWSLNWSVNYHNPRAYRLHYFRCYVPYAWRSTIPCTTSKVGSLNLNRLLQHSLFNTSVSRLLSSSYYNFANFAPQNCKMLRCINLVIPYFKGLGKRRRAVRVVHLIEFK